ncbi:response regulator transcription factor [Pseudoduganella sp. OTU4001]|uniref:response regulator transcription factor n=1 Tax=Pseudoduganella sp. OTU4001 TaxID=3043854 RepID=UPI00313CB0DF
MKILVAEDDGELARRLRDDLTQRGYAVDLAGNGVDAEYLATEWSYDAVVLDLGLPQRPGLEVLRHWRARGNSVPVLILTARDSWRDKVDGLQAGADDYLAKPFHVEELAARLGALIRRAHAQAGGTVTAGGLALDEGKQAVLAHGRLVPLSGVEFRLLRYFMLHPGQVLSKTHLSEHVYDNDAEHDSNVLEVHVNHLRNKLGPACITTRRGQGYVFGAER